MGDTVDDAKKEYLKILLQQYSWSWQSIMEYSSAFWQVPMLLITTISVLGIAFGQPFVYQNQTPRILILLLGFGFTFVSLMAMVKHRFFSICMTKDFENIQAQLERLLKQKEFTSFFKSYENDDPKNVEIKLRIIKFNSRDLAKEHRWLYCRSAYKWQRNLTISVLIGITSLLEYEFWLLGPFCLVVFGIIPFLVFGIWLLIEKRIEETRKLME